MNNMEIFNLTVADVFGQCFENFPVRIEIDSLEIAYRIVELYEEREILERTDLLTRESEVVFNAINWLIDSGYLWCNTSTGDLDFFGVVLTPKGLEVMNSIPASLQKIESFGSIFSKGVKKLGAETAIETVKIALALGVSQINA
ncbi:hypothetical protein [Cellvibrio japonicus]|uniref:hypothetical protein n=1 Tax=Cellvibrio japonicus TaxID=155077 RepID=UPI0005A0DA02|nr:hypothetical protein [Cellvibrio japonicus]QEI11468.1 hypothetical protein FY117_03965 [Cellvibrio japonicus]QEI15042.1 hypothetical protein FY116_03965 [Cellvibrio japonicus]QEI18622.1 hypothetical protein FY115_03965 [Cellvibrio japonicus]